MLQNKSVIIVHCSMYIEIMMNGDSIMVNGYIDSRKVANQVIFCLILVKN